MNRSKPVNSKPVTHRPDPMPRGIGVRLPGDVIDRIDVLAAQRDITRGRIIREAVQVGLPLVEALGRRRRAA